MAKRRDDDDDLVGDPLSGGHNESSNAAGQLLSIVERIERVEEDMKALSDDRKDIYSEAKGMGFEPKAIRKIVSERKQDASERQEFESILELYRQALGMA